MPLWEEDLPIQAGQEDPQADGEAHLRDHLQDHHSDHGDNWD